MKYPIEKYNIVTHQHGEYAGVETIAFSTYAGKTVYGKAICRTDDNYDEATGVKLAVARCAEKIARKRKARAARLLKHANDQLAAAQKYVDNMTHYYNDACAEVEETQSDLSNILTNM